MVSSIIAALIGSAKNGTKGLLTSKTALGAHALLLTVIFPLIDQAVTLDPGAIIKVTIACIAYAVTLIGRWKASKPMGI